MELRLDGKTALVCGSSQGIGRAVAEVFAEMGAELVLTARNADMLEDVTKHLNKNSSQSHSFVAADFNDPQSSSEKIRNHLSGRHVDILVNNSGGPAPGPAHSAAAEEYTEAFNRHMIMSRELLGLVLPGMKERGWGRIMNIISISVKQPIENLGVSNTIRGAMASWAKTLSRELAQYGITVNNILPGHTNTERLQSLFANNARKAGTSPEEIADRTMSLIPAGRFADPKEPAWAAGFLASDKAAFINGINLPVDGGFLRTL